MSADQIQQMMTRTQRMRDALLGQFMIESLKASDPAHYENLMAYFSQRPEFIAGLWAVHCLKNEVAA